MTHRHKQTGRPLELIRESDGRGYFKDGHSTVICLMIAVTDDPSLILPEWPVHELSHYVEMIVPVNKAFSLGEKCAEYFESKLNRGAA